MFYSQRHGQHTNGSFREKHQQREPEENGIIVEDKHELIVSKEIFEKAQQEMEKRKAAHKAAKSPGKYSVSDCNFFGKKIVCADCGKTMYLQRSGTDKAAFNCGTHFLKKKCFSHRVYDTDVYKKVLKLIHKAELLPRISAHNLRHTACTNMARQGMNIKVLQYLMGHANPHKH